MPPAIPLIAALAGAAVSASIAAVPLGVLAGGAFVGFGPTSATLGLLAGGLVAGGLNMVASQAFSPKQKFSSPTTDLTLDSQSSATMVNSTVETHKIIYGRMRVSGPIVYIGTTDSGPIPHSGPATGTNIMLHMVVALAGHEVEEIETIYLDDKPLTLNDDGFATNIPYVYYPENPEANEKVVDTAVRTDGVVTITTTIDHDFIAGDLVTVDIPSDLSMNGDFIIASTPATDTFTYVNGGPNASTSGGIVTDQTIPDAENSYVRVKKHLGASDQSADVDMIAEVPGWDSTHRLQGIAYVYVRLEFNQDVFGRGVPNVSTIVKGKKVYDPRDESTAYSTNVALCIRDYLVSDYGFNCEADEINDTYFEAAANICDEDVELTTGGDQDRYTCNSVLDTASTPIENLNALVAAMAGTVTYVQGQFRAYAGAYEATVGALTTDMLAGEVEVRTRVPRAQLFNGVQGVYVDPNRNWTTTDLPAVTNDTYEEADGGIQILRDIQMPFTNHAEAAQRIAKIVLEQNRQGMQVEIPVNHNALQFAVWDTITYTDAVLGWTDKVFRIKKFGTVGIGPIILSLQEEASTVYDWDSGEATTFDSAPDTTLPNPFVVTVPTGLSYSSTSVFTVGGDTVYSLLLQWTLHEDSFVVNGGQFEFQFRLTADAPSWSPSFFVAGNLTSTNLLNASVNVSYDFRMRAINTLGAHSNWVEIDNAIIGSSGGVGATQDWGNWTTGPAAFQDWGDWTTAISVFDDWGFYT